MYANEIYVTLDDPLNKEEVLDHFNKTFDFAKSQMGSAQEIALRLTPLRMFITRMIQLSTLIRKVTGRQIMCYWVSLSSSYSSPESILPISQPR